MDVVALVIAGGTLIAAGTVAIYDYATANSKAKEKEEEKAVACVQEKSESTIIYRWGSSTMYNLTPREVDVGVSSENRRNY